MFPFFLFSIVCTVSALDPYPSPEEGEVLVQMAVKTASQLAANQEILDQYQALIEAMIASGKGLTTDFVDKVNAEMDRILNATDVMHNAALQQNAEGLQAIKDCANDARAIMNDPNHGFQAKRSAANNAKAAHESCRSDEMSANATLTDQCTRWRDFGESFSLPCTNIPRGVEQLEGYAWLNSPPPEGLPVDEFWACLNATEDKVMSQEFVAAMDPHNGYRHRCLTTEMAAHDNKRSSCVSKQHTFENAFTQHITQLVNTCEEQIDCRNRTAESHHDFCLRNEGDIEARKRQFHSANNIKCYVGALALMGDTSDNSQASHNTNAKEEILKCKDQTYDVSHFDMTCECDANNMSDCPAESCDSSDSQTRPCDQWGGEIWYAYAAPQACGIVYPSR